MPRLFRYIGAVLILVGGVVHLYLYQQGYQSIPKIGPLFLLNVAVALVIGVALAVRPLGAFAVAGLVFSVGTLASFVLSRTTGILGFREMGWDPRASTAFVAEILTLGVLGLWFNATRPKRNATAVIGDRRAERPSERAGSAAA